MSNATTVKNITHELASQVYILATGLQNAAPSGSPGKSVQYLLETASQLERTSAQVELLTTDNDSPNTERTRKSQPK